MFRCFSRAPLVAATCLRFQSGDANASAAPGRGRGGRVFLSTNVLPRFEIHDVRDQVGAGSMTRVAVDGKQLLISQFPQLGPRKADPNDTTPQFDLERRISLRFRHLDLGGFVAVVEERVPSHSMKNNAYDLTFEKTAEGYTLKGSLTRAGSEEKEAWAVDFENQFAVMMEHFLQSALSESFGFRRHLDAIRYQRQEERAAQGGRSGGGRSGRGGRGGSRDGGRGGDRGAQNGEHRGDRHRDEHAHYDADQPF